MPFRSHSSVNYLDRTTIASQSGHLPTTRAVVPFPARPSKRFSDRAASVPTRVPLPKTRFSLGQILANRYRITRALGHGGMGEVYQAEDRQLGGVIALKFLPAEIESNGRRLEMLLAEARIARSVSHPNVCRVHDIGVHRAHSGALHFVAMEFIDGENLASLRKRIGRLPDSKALQVCRELCSGLAAVHACGLLHRDIKPANIMIDKSGHVRLADFGLAVTQGDSVSPAGTPAYMAPEQHTKRQATVHSEIYALGLVIFEIFTGRKAFTAKSQREYAWRHLEHQPPLPSSLVDDFHPDIERLILGCLEKEPERRPPSVEAIAGALRRIQRSGSVARQRLRSGNVLRALLRCSLVDSPQLKVAGSDLRAVEFSSRHDRLVRDLLARHSGHEIDKAHGFLLLFDRPIQALNFALAYHKNLEALSRSEDIHLAARVSIHYGELWLRKNSAADRRRGAKSIEVDGSAKAVTASLMSLAKAGQTLLTRAAFDLARCAADTEPQGRCCAPRIGDHAELDANGVAVQGVDTERTTIGPLVFEAEIDRRSSVK